MRKTDPPALPLSCSVPYKDYLGRGGGARPDDVDSSDGSSDGIRAFNGGTRRRSLTQSTNVLAEFGIAWAEAPPSGAPEIATYVNKCPSDFVDDSAITPSSSGVSVIATLRPKVGGNGAYEVVLWYASSCVYVATLACQTPPFMLVLPGVAHGGKSWLF